MKHSRALRVALLATTGLLGLTVATYGVIYRSRHRVCGRPVAATARPVPAAVVVEPAASATSTPDHEWAPAAPADEEDRPAESPRRFEEEAVPDSAAAPGEDEARPAETVVAVVVEERVVADPAPTASGLDSLDRRRSELLRDGHDFVLTSTAILLFLAAAVTGLLSGHAGLEVLASTSSTAAAVKGAALAALVASIVVAAVHAVANRFLNYLPQERMITFAVGSAALAFGGFLATYLAAATLSA